MDDVVIDIDLKREIFVENTCGQSLISKYMLLQKILILILILILLHLHVFEVIYYCNISELYIITSFSNNIKRIAMIDKMPNKFVKSLLQRLSIDMVEK